MEKEYIVAIISIVGTCAGTVLGFLLSIWYESLKGKREKNAVLQAAINEVLFVSLENNYPVALNKLRSVMIGYSYAINNKKLLSFHQTWLTDPIIEEGRPVSNSLTKEEVNSLLSALSDIKL